LFTSAIAFFAELSTMLLRRRLEGRCAASWITSETVSGSGVGSRFMNQLPTPFCSPFYESTHDPLLFAVTIHL
jgi:hypothetical protein